MARPIRVEFEHAAYHVTARGNERRAVFRDDLDRQRFLDTLQTMGIANRNRESGIGVNS